MPKARWLRLTVLSCAAMLLWPEPAVPQMPASLEGILRRVGSFDGRPLPPLPLPPAAVLPVGSPALAPAPSDEIHLSPEQAQAIGRRIWKNESGGTVNGLTHWNKGEAFASLGIAHFIWYPDGARGPFTESFPAMLASLEAQGVALPDWLRGAVHCPWPDREAFYADFQGSRMRELRGLLEATVAHQARFTAHRLEEALPKILETLPEAQRPVVRARFYSVAAYPTGVYALVDYVNFKGEGVSLSERYNGLGWGLLQVLQEMEEGQPALSAFSQAADAVLTRRVYYSPPERDERRWLAGWRKRVRTYLDVYGR